MTPAEAKKAAEDRLPVKYRDIKYDRILAVIWRVPYPNQRATWSSRYQVELLDYNGNSVTVADPAEVEVCV